MKIDRVILSSNANPTYYHFWNPLAKVYSEKFGIKPTLIWFGTEQEIIDCGIDITLGDFICVEAHKDYHLPWQTTWGLFWATQFYPHDVCWIMGIDQVPLSDMFIKMCDQYSNDDYLMLIADAYKPHYWNLEGSASPSSYHVAKGYTFNKVYSFDKDWKIEATKIHQSGINGFWENTEGRWGIDETYSCLKLRQARNEINIIGLDNFGLLCERRIECERHKETYFDENKLMQGYYSESHLCRPFTNHVEYINRMINLIPCYIQQ